MKSVFLLWHSSSFKEDEDKLLGVYESAASAEAAQQRAEKLPGFCWDISGFIIDEYVLNDDCWTEGFDSLTVIGVPVQGNEKDVRLVRAVMYPVEPEYVYEIFDTQDHEDVPLLFQNGDCVIVKDILQSDGESISVAVEKVDKPIPPKE